MSLVTEIEKSMELLKGMKNVIENDKDFDNVSFEFSEQMDRTMKAITQRKMNITD